MNYVTRTTNTATMNSDSARLKHNHRDPETIKREIEKDPERNFGDISKDKVLYTLINDKHKSYESIVNDIFKEANDARNEAQRKMRHKERCHNTYCSSWKADKKKKSNSPVMEIIIQVGGIYDPKKDYATGKVDPNVGKKIMIDFVNQFIKKYPLLKVIDVSYHQGEATPHIHLDFVPVAKDEKYGLTASLDKACEQMGFGEVSKKDPNKTVFHIKHFENSFHELLDNICLQHGIEIEHPKLNRNHESVKEYKENEKLRQENEQLKIDNQTLEESKQDLENKLHEKEEDLYAFDAGITEARRDLDYIKSEIKHNQTESDEIAATINEKRTEKNKLTDDVAALNAKIEEKETYFQNMSAEQISSDLFDTLSNNIKEQFDHVNFFPFKAKDQQYTKGDFKRQKIGDGYIVSESDLDNLLKNQYDFNKLRDLIEKLFDEIKAYIKKIYDQISQELIKREKAVESKEKEIKPAYENARNLEYKYNKLRELIEKLFEEIKIYIKKIYEQISQDLIKREKAIESKEKEIAPAYENARNLEYKYNNLVKNQEEEYFG